MEKVLGLGGIFVRARDREALARWYGEHLGLVIDETWWGAVLPLRSEHDRAGAYAVWSSFPPDTDSFGARDNGFMVNFRVRDLHAMLAQLRAAGCVVDDHAEESDFGRFGWVTDPEGNRVELWEPPDTPPPA
jgi:predicted enzyme related to lactoylglutathione lyase